MNKQKKGIVSGFFLGETTATLLLSAFQSRQVSFQSYQVLAVLCLWVFSFINTLTEGLQYLSNKDISFNSRIYKEGTEFV